MKKLFVVVTALALAIGLPSATNAQVGFMAGMLLGSSMASGGSNSVQGEGNANVLYVAPRIADRLSEPFAVRTAYIAAYTTDGRGYVQQGFTLQERFGAIFKHPLEAERYEVLQVIRLADQGYAKLPYLWFAYIEKSKILPLDKLPPPK